MIRLISRIILSNQKFGVNTSISNPKKDNTKLVQTKQTLKLSIRLLTKLKSMSTLRKTMKMFLFSIT